MLLKTMYGKLDNIPFIFVFHLPFEVVAGLVCLD